MRFLLEPGDLALAEPCRPEELRAGELALLVKWRGGFPAGYVVHRVLATAFSGRLVLTKGDANFLPDLPFSSFQPAGRVVAAGGREVAPSAAWPLAVLYSLAAGKALSAAAHAVYFLFSGAVGLLPKAGRGLFNSGCLYWETGLYPALVHFAARPLRRDFTGKNGSSGTVKTGRITSNETWSGTVTVADYLTIEPGASVRVEPGTEIIFERREPWFFPVLRSGLNGERRELDSGLAKVLVHGEFLAGGAAERPVIFRGRSFGGVYALGSGAIRAHRCVFSGAGGAALGAWDHAFLQAEDCVFDGCSRGVELFCQAAGTLRDCVFSGLSGPAARALDETSLVLLRTSARDGAGPAFEFSGTARGDLRAVSVRGVERALSASGTAALSIDGFLARDCSAGTFLADGGARLDAVALSVAGGGFGLAANGAARISLRSSGVTGTAGHAAFLSGNASLKAEGCSFTGNSAGLAAAGRCELLLRSCEISGNSGPAVKASGYNSLELRGCRLEGGVSGVEALGLNRVSVLDCVLRGAGGHAAQLHRAEDVSFLRCAFENSLEGISLHDCRGFRGESLTFLRVAGSALKADGRSPVLLSKAVFSEGRTGVMLEGTVSARLERCRFESQTEAAVVLAGGASAALDGCGLSGGRSGVKASGRARLAATNCSFSGLAGAALELRGTASALMSGGIVSDCAGGASVSGSGELDLARTSFLAASLPAISLDETASLTGTCSSLTSSADAVYCSGEASAALDGCLLHSLNAAALELRGGRARLKNCVLRGARGLQAAPGSSASLADSSVEAADSGIYSAGRLRAAGVAVKGGRLGGVSLSGPAVHLRSVRVEEAPSPGVTMPGGIFSSASGVSVDGLPWSPPAAPSGCLARRALFGFAAATSGIGLFSSFYRAIYLAAAAAATVLLKTPAVRALYLYRGMAQSGWEPGLSDMDLACVTKPDSPAGECGTALLLARRLRLLRTVFPFTGEVLIADENSFAAFMGAWGTKAAEFPEASRLLAGEPLPAAGTPRTGGIADRTEAFYAYTLLMGHFFSKGLPENFRRRNCLKGLLDIMRYLSVDGTPGRLSRRAFGAAAGLPPEGYMRYSAQEYAWRAFAALHAASPEAPAQAAAQAGAAPGWFNSAAFEAARLRLSAAAGLPLSLVLDSLYRVYVLLPDQAAGDRKAYLAVCAALAAERAAAPALAASPLVLTRASFAELCRLPYLNNPAFGTDLLTAQSGRRPQDGGVFFAGETPAPAPAPGSPAAAAAHFRASWRSLWGEMPPHYFYTRCAGLRLLLQCGHSPSFCDPRALRKALLAAGIDAPEWEEFLRGGAGPGNYEWVASMTAALGRLADAR